MRLLLLCHALSCMLFNFLYSQEPGDHTPIDPRILLHYPLEEISSMSEEKFANIKYYYCDSYTIDSSDSESFNINSFDITLYEKYRLENDYKTIESNGLKITLTPKSLAAYLVNYNPQNYRHE